MIRQVTGWWRRPTVLDELVLEGGRFDRAKAASIVTNQELSSLRPGLLQLLDEQFHVQSLAGRLCPVLLEDQTVALFALEEHVGSDQADELTRRVLQRGYTLAEPARYILTAPLLLAISRGQLLSSAGGATVVEHSKTALADAFQNLLEWGVRHGASDLHINLCLSAPVSEVRYTVAGQYVAPACFSDMPTSMLRDMLAVAWMDIQGGNGAVFDPLAEQQGSVARQVDGKNLILRWGSMAAERGPSVCLRLLVRDESSGAPGLAELGYFPDQIQQIHRAINSEGGAVLFAGTVGSGKSTTLASLISRLPDYRKVITVEDPVEYLIPRAIQNTVVRSLDSDAHDHYAAKLRALKRSAMSDVLLGEIRDRETGLAFMDLAGSGVNVYSTVHAPAAALVPERLSSDFIGVSRDFLTTPGLLKLLVYQALLPTLCQHCALPASSLAAAHAGEQRDWLTAIETLYGCSSQGLKIRNPAGCTYCRKPQLPQLNGYVGRTVAAEILEPALCPGYLESLRDRRVHLWMRDAQFVAMSSNSDVERRSAMDSAMAKAFQGMIDPRDVEWRFQAFQTLLLQRHCYGGQPQVSARLRVIS